MSKSSLYNKISNIQSLRNKVITPSNLKQNISVFGVTGNYTNGATAKTTDIAEGSTAYVNGSMITGSLNIFDNDKSLYDASETFSFYPNNTSQNFTGTFNNQAYVHNQQNMNRTMRIGDLVIRNGAQVNLGYNTISSKLGITPMMIKKDVQVLDITGQYDASTEFSGIKMDPVKASTTAQPLIQSITEVSGLDMTEGTNLASYFAGLTNLVSVSNLSAPNVTNILDMFTRCYNLSSITEVNLYNDSQNNIIPAHWMFCEDGKLVDIPNTVKFPKEVDGYQMFGYCSNLSEINTPIKLRNSAGAFVGCSNLRYVDVTLNSVNYYSTNNTFTGCSNLSDISCIKVSSNALYSTELFNGCTNLNLSTSSLSNLKVINTNSMFSGCKQLTKPQLLNFINNQYYVNICEGMLSGTNLDSILTINDLPNNKYHTDSSASRMYSNCQNITKVSLDDFFEFFPRANRIYSAFENCRNLTEVTHNNQVNFSGTYWSTDNLFFCCSNLKTANIRCNRLQATRLFADCKSLQSVNLYNTKITSYQYMFCNCYNLSTIDITESSFLNNPSVSYNYYEMCRNCHNLKYNRPINIYTNTVLNNSFCNCGNITSDIDINMYNVNTYYSIMRSAFYNIGSTNINISVASNTVSVRPVDGIIKCLNLKNLSVNATTTYTNGAGVYNVSPISNCPNISSYRLNILKNGSTANISLAQYSTANNINVDFNNIGFTSYVAFRDAIIYSNINCLNISNLSSANYLDMNTIFFNSTVNQFILDIPNNVPIAYLSAKNCALSDSVIDNILGIVGTHTLNNNGSAFKTNNILNMSKMFNNCNVTQERISNLPNYQNLINNGWQYAP